MLRPQDSETRERKNLSGMWDFRLDHQGVGRDQRWFADQLGESRQMPVPASFNDLVTDLATRDFFGDIWYQTTVRVPRGWSAQRLALYVESATHRATVWVDETEVVSHEGGYLPFEADLTDVVRPGTLVRLTLCVNNSLSFQSVPPDTVVETASGPKLKYWHDFFNYAGIHRPLWLVCTPQQYLDDITVVTGLAGERGTVSYTAVAKNAEGLDVRAILRDEDGQQVAATAKRSWTTPTGWASWSSTRRRRLA